VAKLGCCDLVGASGGTYDDVGEAAPGSHRRVVLEPLAGEPQNSRLGETSEESLPLTSLVVVTYCDARRGWIDSDADDPSGHRKEVSKGFDVLAHPVRGDCVPAHAQIVARPRRQADAPRWPVTRRFSHDRSETGGDKLSDDISHDLDAISFVNRAAVDLGLWHREQQVDTDSELFAGSNKGRAVNARRRRRELEAFRHAPDGGATPAEWQPARPPVMQPAP